jgi:hypothetical protein
MWLWRNILSPVGVVKVTLLTQVLKELVAREKFGLARSAAVHVAAAAHCPSGFT